MFRWYCTGAVSYTHLDVYKRQSNILKPSLARGELQLIGATTIVEYRKYIEKDAALERRFQPVTVEEPDREQCLEILKGLRGKYEEHHHVTVSYTHLDVYKRQKIAILIQD